eukprot:5210954-Prymnesium_polylepis.1
MLYTAPAVHAKLAPGASRAPSDAAAIVRRALCSCAVDAARSVVHTRPLLDRSPALAHAQRAASRRHR